jgi:hypothetical protein
MDMATAAVTIVSIAAVKAGALLGLWLRLRSRAHREQARQQYLARVARAAPADGHLELQERRGNGHHLHMKITRSPAAKENKNP